MSLRLININNSQIGLMSIEYLLSIKRETSLKTKIPLNKRLCSSSQFTEPTTKKAKIEFFDIMEL